MPATKKELEYEWFTDLPKNEKGDLGEMLAELYIRQKLREEFGIKYINPKYDILLHSNSVDREGNLTTYKSRVDLLFDDNRMGLLHNSVKHVEDEAVKKAV